MHHSELTQRVRDRVGTGAPVEHGIRETLVALAARLPANLCARAADALPPLWKNPLTSHPGACSAGPVDELYLEVANALEIPLGEAVELSQVVVSELADAIGPDHRRVLALDLPDDWAALLRPPARASSTPPRDGLPPQPGAAGDPRGADHRIATARPGAAKPIADSHGSTP